MQKIIKNRFKNINESDKIIIFTHPKQFSSMYLERVNPNHVGLVWGKRNKKYRKIHGNNWVKICKIQFAECVAFTFNNLYEKLFYWLNYASVYIEKTGVFSFAFSIFCALLFYFTIFKISGGIK